MARSSAWKTVEQDVGRLLQRAAGKVTSVPLINLVSSTGRVGHMPELQVDIMVGEGTSAYAIEAKRRALPKWITEALVQVQRVASDWDRLPAFAFALNSEIKQRVIKTKRGSIPVERTWIAFTLDNAAELLLARRYIEELGAKDIQVLTAWWGKLDELRNPPAPSELEVEIE